ncbi:MAG: hypothetical protein JRS35_01475 [Deltaproteobacteria bacterium]|nr:hypothetical protein [Deltaproteobacteria bacterium]
MAHKNDTQAQEVETVIIGGGISGLACARHLHDSNIPFILITDHLGGRLALSERGHYLGAVMFNNDYIHVKQHARKSFKSRPWHSYIWDGSKGVNTILRINFLKLFRLNKVFGEFSSALEQFRTQAPYTCQKTLMEQDPLLRRLVSQSVGDFVREQHIEALAERFLGPVAGAVFLCDWKQMNAFHFCIAITCTGNGACNADWSGTIDSLTQGYSDTIVIDKVKSIRETDRDQTYQVRCKERQYTARRVVLSVPGAAGNELLNISGTSQGISCHVFHIDGRRRALYRPKRSLLMGADEEIKLFFFLPDGIDVVYSGHAEPDFSRYYEDHTVIGHHFWQPAIQLSQVEWRPLQRSPNLFTIGDNNICGLEDSYLTGLFAANKIIEQSRIDSNGGDGRSCR